MKELIDSGTEKIKKEIEDNIKEYVFKCYSIYYYNGIDLKYAKSQICSDLNEYLKTIIDSILAKEEV